MDSSRKKLIFWSGLIAVFVMGCALSLSGVLQVKNITIFIFGLSWLWQGITLLSGMNCYHARNYGRKAQLVFSVSSIGLGVAWSLISLSPLSRQAMPMILVSLPFILLDFVMYLRNRSK